MRSAARRPRFRGDAYCALRLRWRYVCVCKLEKASRSDLRDVGPELFDALLGDETLMRCGGGPWIQRCASSPAIIVAHDEACR